jgi:hypothetical protein
MSQEFDLCRDSGDDNRVRPNPASVPSLSRFSKRLREKEASYNDTHPRNGNGLKNKTATVAAEFVVDLELADEVEAVSPHKKRRVVVRSKAGGKNDAGGNCAQVLEGIHATEKDVGSEFTQVADHRESHEGIAVAAAAASHPMPSDSEQTSRNDGSANKHSQKLSTSKPASSASIQQWRVSAWEGRLSELADYCKIHGHCNVPRNYIENTKLANWVGTQRKDYKSQLEGKTSSMTLSRIQELETLGFVWDCSDAPWEDRLSELANYRKIHGHCNVPAKCRENTKLGNWVGTQRLNYKLRVEGKTSYMTVSRIQELESLSFVWDCSDAAWESRRSELADYRKTHGHCNVPKI